MSGLGKAGLAALGLLLLLLFAGVALPFARIGAENRLEQRCSTLASFTYERDSPLPFLWTCTGLDNTGQTQTFNVW